MKQNTVNAIMKGIKSEIVQGRKIQKIEIWKDGQDGKPEFFGAYNWAVGETLFFVEEGGTEKHQYYSLHRFFRFNSFNFSHEWIEVREFPKAYKKRDDSEIKARGESISWTAQPITLIDLCEALTDKKLALKQCSNAAFDQKIKGFLTGILLQPMDYSRINLSFHNLIKI